MSWKFLIIMMFFVTSCFQEGNNFKGGTSYEVKKDSSVSNRTKLDSSFFELLGEEAINEIDSLEKEFLQKNKNKIGPVFNN